MIYVFGNQTSVNEQAFDYVGDKFVIAFIANLAILPVVVEALVLASEMIDKIYGDRFSGQKIWRSRPMSPATTLPHRLRSEAPAHLPTVPFVSLWR